MKLLLDTATFLWLTIDSPLLSAQTRNLFTDPANEVYLSAVSAWEIAVKHAIGKLPLPEKPNSFIPRQRALHGIASLSLAEDAALKLPMLPSLHRDPFDRMLVCQALAHDLTILTPDAAIRSYPVKSAW